MIVERFIAIAPVFSDEKKSAQEMFSQGQEMFSWIPNAYIKYPCTAEGLRAAEMSVKQGLRVNITLCFSQQQAAAVYAATKDTKEPAYVSPFVGRLDDIGQSGMDVVKNIKRMFSKGDGHVLVLAASIRSLEHLFYCFVLQTELATVPAKLLEQWASKNFPIPENSFSTSRPVNRSLTRISTWNDRGKRLIFDTSSQVKVLRNSPLIIGQHSPDLHERCSWKRSRPPRRVGHWPVGYRLGRGDCVTKAANNTGLLSAPEAVSVSDTLGVVASLRLHWPEYLMEAWEMSLFMFCTCSFATLLQHPASPVRHFFISGIVRRALMGLAIGATVMALIMSPWGKQSGGHINPAMTFAFYRLGKLHSWDTLFYWVAQFSGATIGVALATFLLRGAPRDSTVRYAVTAPGVYGAAVAFAAELAISFILMMTVLLVTNHERLARYTPYFVGSLYAVNITFETPLSGMSMNPARTFGPAAYGGYWHTLWIYFIAPTVGMLAAAETFLRIRRGIAPYCAKLHHANHERCIFHHTPHLPKRRLYANTSR